MTSPFVAPSVAPLEAPVAPAVAPSGAPAVAPSGAPAVAPFVAPAVAPFVAADLHAPRLSHIVSSPIGRLLLLGDGHALTGLWMVDSLRFSGRHSARVGEGLTPSPATFAEVETQLGEYFAGDRKEFTVPLAPSGTPFQLAVWTELTKIPYGSTTSYGDIARALGKRLVASRAVGLANGANPISVIVPCHRVIGADGSLTGYGGGLDRKELLLRLEGAGPVTLW